MFMSAHAVSDDRHSQVHTEIRSPIETILGRIVLFVFGVIEVLIALRFLLKLFGANTQAAFVDFIYGLSDVFMAPFVAVFQTDTVSGAQFEWSALLAIAIYALIAWGFIALIRAVSPREHAETVETSREDDAMRTKTP